MVKCFLRVQQQDVSEYQLQGNNNRGLSLLFVDFPEAADGTLGKTAFWTNGTDATSGLFACSTAFAYHKLKHSLSSPTASSSVDKDN